MVADMEDDIIYNDDNEPYEDLCDADIVYTYYFSINDWQDCKFAVNDYCDNFYIELDFGKNSSKTYYFYQSSILNSCIEIFYDKDEYGDFTNNKIFYNIPLDKILNLDDKGKILPKSEEKYMNFINKIVLFS